jgi:hypothetical protein
MEAQSWKHTMGHSNVEDKVISLFEPDTLVSTQYLESFHRKTPIEPEKMLMLAVLEDAINCFQVNVVAERGRAKKLFDETMHWFLDRNDDWIFSFGSVCEMLQLNPEYVRGGLLRWKEKKLARTHADSRGKKVMAGLRLAANDHS